MHCDVTQRDMGGKCFSISGRSRVFGGDPQVGFAFLIRLPEDLWRASGGHAVRSPEVQPVRIHVGVHELAEGVSRADLFPLTPRVAKTEGGLSGFAADANQVEFERCVNFATRCRKGRFHAETAVTRAEIEASVLAKLVGKRRQLRRSIGVEPLRIVLLQVGDGVGLGKPIDLHCRLRIRSRLRGRWCAQQAGRHETGAAVRSDEMSAAHRFDLASAAGRRRAVFQQGPSGRAAATKLTMGGDDLRLVETLTPSECIERVYVVTRCWVLGARFWVGF